MKTHSFTAVRLMKTAICLWAVISLSTAYADENSKKNYLIKARVVDEQLQAIENVNVWVSSTYTGTVTNQEGIFSLFLPEGTHRLKLSCIGYESIIADISCPADSMLLFTLHATSVLCEGIIVSSSYANKETPMSISTLNKEELHSKNIESALPYVIEMEPSVVASSENGTQVGNTSFRLRGTDPSRINVNINGIPLNDAESQQVFWANIPNITNMAQSVQIQRGIGANTGGTGTFGGAVSLLTLYPKENFSAMSDLSLGSFNTFQATINLASGITRHGFSAEASYTHLSTDGYIRNGNCKHHSVFVSLGKYSPKSLLKFIAIIGQQKTGITWNGTPSYMLSIDRTYNNAGLYYDDAGNEKYYDNETDNYGQQLFQLYYSYSFNKAWQLNITGNYTHGYGYYENYVADADLLSMGIPAQTTNNITHSYSDLTKRECEKNHYGVAIISTDYKGKKTDLSLGETFTYYHGFYYGKTLWIKYNENIHGNVVWYENGSNKIDATTFAKINYHITPHWLLYADLQYRYIYYIIDGTDNDMASMNQKNIYHFANPKIGFTYHPDSPHKVYMVIGLANREPTRSDIKDATKYGAHDQPKAEHMLDVEAGYEYHPLKWKIGVNLYFMGYKDQLTATGKLNTIGYAIMENVDKSYRMGIEICGGVNVCRWLKINANLSLSRNKILNYIYYEDTYNNPSDWEPMEQTRINMGTTNLALSPNIVGVATLHFEPCKNLYILLTGKYVGKQYYDNTSRPGSLLKDYFIMNSQISYTLPLKKEYSIELQFQVNNILNTSYVNNGWGYTARFADGSEPYITNGLYAQPGINVAGRIVFKL